RNMANALDRRSRKILYDDLGMRSQSFDMPTARADLRRGMFHRRIELAGYIPVFRRMTRLLPRSLVGSPARPFGPGAETAMASPKSALPFLHDLLELGVLLSKLLVFFAQALDLSCQLLDRHARSVHDLAANGKDFRTLARRMDPHSASPFIRGPVSKYRGG